MRRMSHIGRTVLAAWLLWCGSAFGESPAVQEEWSCKDECKQELKGCTDACERYAKAGTGVCIQACAKLHTECLDECKPSRKGKEQRHD